MVRREIELGEIVIVGLDVGTFGDRKAHVGEDRSQFVDHLRDRMHPADLGGRFAHRQRHVDAFGIEPRRKRRALEYIAARRERGVDAILEAVDQRPLTFAFFRRQRTECLQQSGDRSALAERGYPHGFERGFVVAAASAPRICCSSCAVSAMTASLRHERQIGIGRLGACLRQHAMHLAAVMRRVIE